MLKTRMIPEKYIVCEICEKEISKQNCFNYFEHLYEFFKSRHDVKSFMESNMVFCDDCIVKYSDEIEEVLYNTFVNKIKDIKEKHING